jgi:hypothetical protein
MPPQALLDLLDRQPFEPFRIVMTDGTGYDIRHPGLCMTGRRNAAIGVPRTPDERLYDRLITVALLHIQRLEPLPVAAGPRNGEAAG